MVKGKKEDAVSELEQGRRTIVRDPDDPAFEANILDSLMISRQDEIDAERDVIYRPVRRGRGYPCTHSGNHGCGGSPA